MFYCECILVENLLSNTTGKINHQTVPRELRELDFVMGVHLNVIIMHNNETTNVNSTETNSTSQVTASQPVNTLSSRIEPGAEVKHPTYGADGVIHLNAMVNDVDDKEENALCRAQNEPKEKWLPINELTLVKPAPTGQEDDFFPIK